MMGCYFYFHRLWCDRKNMLGEQFGDHMMILVRDESHGDLGGSLRWENGLGTFTCIATPDAVAVECWSHTGTFKRCISFFAGDLFNAELFLVFIEIERSSIECLS